MPKAWKKEISDPTQVEGNQDSEEARPDSQRSESLILAAELGDSLSLDLHDADDVEEGMRMLDQFLNQGFLEGAEVVEIIHGRGTGAMRRAVHGFLKDHALVKFFRDAENPSSVLGATYAVLEKKD